MKAGFLLLRCVLKARLHHPFELIKLGRPPKKQVVSQQPLGKQIDSDSDDFLDPVVKRVVSKRITIADLESVLAKMDRQT
jgi:hypothetical protein